MSQYTLVNTGEEQFITVFVPGDGAYVAQSDHPNFDAIVAAAVAGEDIPSDLFDIAAAAAKRFEPLSERVRVAHGRVYLDGEEVDNALTKQIRRFLDEGVEDWQSLVAFFEKVQTNPQEHSREQLFEWLDRHDFTITPEGDIVAYKGVAGDGNGSYRSISSGSEQVLVDGEPHQGQIPNPVGATVEMARGLVHHDPAQGCSRGLHVGTYDYAKSFSRGAVLEVHVNPRDVVSVPTDCDWAKVRCCRYRIVDTIDTPYSSAVLDPDGSDLDDEGWWDDDEF